MEPKHLYTSVCTVAIYSIFESSQPPRQELTNLRENSELEAENQQEDHMDEGNYRTGIMRTVQEVGTEVITYCKSTNDTVVILTTVIVKQHSN